MKKNFLKTSGTKITTADGKPIRLKGVNLGGWLLMEGYILHAPNRAERVFKEKFRKALGTSSLDSFEESFRKNFISENDFKTIRGFGFNCIRLPFHYRLIERSPYEYDQNGLFYLEEAIRWAKRYGLYLILDLHAAPGAQNHDWHSDSLGRAELWKSEAYQRRTYALWEFLADRYKEEETIAGYDLLNESVLHDTRLLNRFYRTLIKTIRRVDRNHILFVEGNKWAMDLACLDDFSDSNLVLSIHAYQPLDFTFNVVPQLTYPLKGKGCCDKNELKKILLPYAKIAQKNKRPIFVGEFGINARAGVYGENRWVADMLSLFREFDFHWTYWTYKAIKNSVFPDGILSYMENPPWVNRAGPLYGWETYSLHWPTKQKEMVDSWKTKNFEENTLIREILQNASR